MIQLPISFSNVNSAEQFVSTLSEYPYACDLTSGTRSVDAKSLIGVLALSHRTDLNLLIHELPSEVSEDLLEKLSPYTLGNLEKGTQQSA